MASSAQANTTEEDYGIVGDTEEIVLLTKVTERAEGLGRSLVESRARLAAIQKRIVEAQVNCWLQKHRRYAISRRRLRSKGSYLITLRTLFGDVRLKSPRYYVPKERQTNGPATISPLTQLFPDHTAPERLYLETRWASLVPYAAAAELLADFLPIESGINATTLRQYVLRTAERMEGDLAEQQTSFTEGADPRDWDELPIPKGRMVIGLNGGYIRDWRDRKRNFELIVGRSMPEEGAARYIGFVHGYDRKPQRRVIDHLRRQGFQANQDLICITDGGDEVRALSLICEVASRTLDMAPKQSFREFEITTSKTVENSDMLNTCVVNASGAQLVKIGVLGHAPQIVLLTDSLDEKAVMGP
jgi:hypothetical protein